MAGRGREEVCWGWVGVSGDFGSKGMSIITSSKIQRYLLFHHHHHHNNDKDQRAKRLRQGVRERVCVSKLQVFMFTCTTKEKQCSAVQSIIHTSVFALGNFTKQQLENNSRASVTKEARR